MSPEMERKNPSDKRGRKSGFSIWHAKSAVVEEGAVGWWTLVLAKGRKGKETYNQPSIIRF